MHRLTCIIVVIAAIQLAAGSATGRANRNGRISVLIQNNDSFAFVRATKLEFEWRFWIILAIYAVGFFLSRFDQTTTFAALRHFIVPSLDPGDLKTRSIGRLIIGAGAFLVFFAAALRTWAAAYLRTDVVHDPNQHSEALVADGPFRYTRNPLYFANVPMAAGIGVLASRLGWLFLVLANWMFVYRLILREEEALRQSQGNAYLAYSAAVPRFWPSFKPRVSPANREPGWGQAFAGESFVWLFGAAELCLAVTSSWRLTAVIFGLGFLAHFLCIPLVRRSGGKADHS